MNTAAEHPHVTAYLREFDRAAAQLTSSRRFELREEIANHLRESIPPSLSPAEAAAMIAAFGSSAEVLGHEDIPDQSGTGSRAPRRRYLVLGAAVIVVAGLVIALLFWQPTALFVAETEPGANQSAEGPASVVNEDPTGPARVTEGTAYFEYLAAIKAMPEPLPNGAAYPSGVPAGLDSGRSGDGVVQSGLGANLAHFAWLCAWEAEYLSASSEDDAERQVAAELMLEQWPSYDYVSDSGDGWTKNVLEPLRFGDPTGLQKDFPQTCSQAGITNVNSQ